MDTNPLGLNRLLSYEERREIESELGITFLDTQDALRDAQNELKELGKLIHRIFYGASCENEGW
jgi:hypothetical protein